MKIANIVSSSKIEIDNSNNGFNIVKSITNIIPNLPTLIVGLDKIEKLRPDFDIMEYKISENLFWTFSKNEKRDKYIEGLNYFITDVYNNLVSNIKYVYIDPIHYNFSKIKKIIKKINELKDPIIYSIDNK